MATTISSYAVSLNLDAASYIKNSSLSRNETGRLKREIDSARTPLEKYEHKLSQLDKALKEGAIEHSTYIRLVRQTEDAYNKVALAGQKVVKEQKQINDQTGSKFVQNIKRYVAAWASLHTVATVFRNIREEMLSVDLLAKTSRALGESATGLERFRLAASEIAGVDAPAADTALMKLNKRIGEASLGMGEAVKIFDALNLDIAQLSQLRPEEQFLAVSSAIQKIGNSTEQAALANKLFEEAGARLLPLLRSSSREYEASAGGVNRLAGTLDDKAVGAIERANDAFGRLNLAVDGFFRSVASFDFGGGVGLAEIIDGYSDALAALSSAMLSFSADAKQASDNWARFVGLLKGPQASVDTGMGLLDPGTYGATAGTARSGASRNLPNAGLFGSSRPSAMADFADKIGENLGKVAEDGFQSLRRGIFSGSDAFQAFGSIANSLEGVASGINQQLAEDDSKKSQLNDQLAKSFEVGSQEAYQYIAQQGQTEKAKEEQRQREQLKLSERSTVALEALVKWSQDQGFAAIRR